MTRPLTIIVAFLATAACQHQAPPNEPIAQRNKVVAPALPDQPGLTPPVVAAPAIPDSDKTPAAAKKIVEDYFTALAERRFPYAYRMFPGSGMSASALAASHANYRTFEATVGAPGETEGGAGSIYIEIPVVVTGTLRSGAPFRLAGPVSLRRVNDVDGATEAQLRWHIFSSDLKPRP